MIKIASLKTRTAQLVVVIGLVMSAGTGFYCWQQSQPLPVPQHLQDLGGDFVLQSADGPLALEELRGKVVLLYFGYLNCPDICPLTMANWADAFNQLSVAEQGSVRGLLVSIDPGRDTPEKLEKYTNYFHPNIIGLTGGHKELAEITLLYRSDYSVERGDESDNYTVSHMSFVYVIDPKGKLREILSHESSPVEIKKSIRNALKVKV